MQQSFSLLRTHLLFSKIQSENPFVRKYMKYLYHREFGIDHVPWFVSDQFTNYNDVNYWLEQWIKFYSDIHFKFNSHKNCFFLRYENLSKRETIEKISHDLEILPDKRADFKISKKSISEKFDKNLYIEAMKIYENIVSY